MMFDTIVALATAPIKSALMIVRLSGDDALAIASRLFSKTITKEKKNGIHYGHIIIDNQIIDEVVVLVFIAPHSFTGENCVEIICHGSPLIANRIIEATLAYGARNATAGEFSSRAYLNRRIDLVQAEAINDIINATTIESQRLAMLSLHGEASKLVKPLKKQIADIVSLIEVNIDYPEYEDIEKVNRQKIIKNTNTIHNQLLKLIDQGRQGKIIKEGINLAIIGKPNVGKSSLLNALIKEDKAIVTEYAGTTRDIVEGDINLNGVVLHLFDTAGIHDAPDIIEEIGIKKSKKTIEKADLVIVVLDATTNITEEDRKILEITEQKKRIIVYNKADISKEKQAGQLYISALTKDITALETEIIRIFGIDQASYIRPSLNNARQLGLLKQIDNSIMVAKTNTLQGASLDVISASLQEAYYLISRLLGEEANSDIQTEIFKRFCVGK
jgi:tRNA modification GTPase